MARYFERADNCARVLDATWNLMLSGPSLSREQRWYRALLFIGLPVDAVELDAQSALVRLASDRGNAASIVACITAARENASQVRDEISSEMWERLNRLYHEVTRAADKATEHASVSIVATVREGSLLFQGVTDATMNHGEGWDFVQLGKYFERACALSVLLDAYFSTKAAATDLDWMGLLTSCSAFEAYCKVYTADLKPEFVAEFILLHPEFPYSVRFAAERMQRALEAVGKRSAPYRSAPVERIMGRLRSSLAYLSINEVMGGNFRGFLDNIIEQARDLHAALHNVYIEYPVEVALEI